jgi:hypothetical protein
MIMAIIMHPLTAKNGSPEYTADDYRHAINPLLVPSDGTAFNGLSGIRYGSPSPLVTVSGLTATVKAHCGTISPWDGLGAYTYAITTNTTVNLADSTNNYKIAITVEDPSQSHGTTPRGKIEVFTAGTPDSKINGLVIAKVAAGVASDVAPMIRNSAILMARNLEQLNTIDAVDGQEAVTMADNVHYVRNSGTWVSDALKTSSHGGWSITECVRNGFCTISANRTYQGSTGSFNAYVQDYKPATPYFECYGTLTGRVGLQVVSYGYCMVTSQGLLVSFNGYGNSVSLSAGIVYPIKYDG